jgi:hypothetical protein
VKFTRKIKSLLRVMGSTLTKKCSACLPRALAHNPANGLGKLPCLFDLPNSVSSPLRLCRQVRLVRDAIRPRVLSNHSHRSGTIPKTDTCQGKSKMQVVFLGPGQLLVEPSDLFEQRPEMQG